MTTPFMKSIILSIATAVRHRRSSGQDAIQNVRPQVARSYIAIRRNTGCIDKLWFDAELMEVRMFREGGGPYAWRFDYLDPELCDQISDFMAKEYGASGLAWPEKPSVNGC